MDDFTSLRDPLMRMLLVLLIVVLGHGPGAASAQRPRDVEGAFRRLHLPRALIAVAGADEATARRLLGAPRRAGMATDGIDRPVHALFYTGPEGSQIEIHLCGPATVEEFACRGSRAASPAVYEVSIRRPFPDEPAKMRFEAFAHETLGAASVRTWRECDMPNYDLEGGATATVESALGPSAFITLFRTPPPRQRVVVPAAS